jgi:hypothetical protein
MKKLFLRTFCALIVTTLPGWCLAEYIIQLKDEGQYTTRQYGHEGGYRRQG